MVIKYNVPFQVKNNFCNLSPISSKMLFYGVQKTLLCDESFCIFASKINDCQNLSAPSEIWQNRFTHTHNFFNPLYMCFMALFELF